MQDDVRTVKARIEAAPPVHEQEAITTNANTIVTGATNCHLHRQTWSKEQTPTISGIYSS